MEGITVFGVPRASPLLMIGSVALLAILYFAGTRSVF